MSAPGQTVTETDKSVFISTQKQALCGMAMVCERGPIGEGREVVDWADFQRVYGGYVAGQVGQHCAKVALDNGCHLLVSRVVHLTDPADLSTRTSAPATVTAPDRSSAPTHGRSTGSGVFPARITAGGTLVFSINGAGDVTVTFRATRATKTGAAATYDAVTAGHKLVLVVNGVTREADFAGTEATQAAFLDAINAGVPGVAAFDSSGEVRLATDRYGSSASISVDASSSADVLTSLGLTASAGSNAGPNDVADTEAVTASEFTALVQATGRTAGADDDGHPYIQSSTTGTGSTVQVKGSSTLATAFGFDTTAHAGTGTVGVDTVTFDATSDGTWAHALRVVVDDDPGEPAARFRVRITVAATGAVLETWPGLSMDSTDPKYVVNVLRENSLYFTATNEDSATVAPDNRPAAGTYTPASGADGTSGIVQADYIGDATGHTGLHALDGMRGMRLVALPGVTDPDIQIAADAYCVARKDVAFIGSTPLASDPSDAVKFRRGTTPYTHTAVDSNRSNLYFGWHEILHPVTKQPLWIPVDGEVFAAFARSNKALGPWLPAAGSKRGKLQTGVRRMKYDPSPEQQNQLYDAGINYAYKDADFGYVLWGQKNLQKADSALQRLNVRLLIDFIGEQVGTAERGELFELNDSDLWRTLAHGADNFVERIQVQRGVVSYRVISDASNNTPSEVSARRTHVDVYVIPTEASEEQHIGITVLPQGFDLQSNTGSI
jgi:hypothetical protein